jgi:DNA sulfur modification protein DndB
LVNIEEAALRGAKTASLVRRLKTVDWRRDKHWEGIAGKFTLKGAFSVGGSKETAYAIYEALNDETSSGFVAVRTSATAQAAE